MDPVNEELNGSFDSSVELDELSLTQTTNSLPPQFLRGATETVEFDLESVTLTPKKQVNPFQLPEQFAMDNAFVGFKNGWGQKEIKINQSKLKRAKQFFDDTQLEQLPECNTVGFCAMNLTKERSQEPEEYSMPCFKSVGSGAQVKISDQAKQKAINLFQEFKSIKKPTKMKKASKINTQSLVKTSNIESKFKIEGQMMYINRKSFNWEQYQKQFKMEIQKEKQGKKKGKRTTQPRKKHNQNILNSSRQFIFVKLFSLTISSEDELKSSSKLAAQVRNIPSMKFSHNSQECSILQCIFCRIGSSKQFFQARDIYQIFNKQFSKKWVSRELFQPLYNQVCFKLLKYQAFWPEILNKRCHVSNIMIEVNKKLLKTQKQAETSFLRYCIVQQQIGRRINLIVQDKYFNQRMKIVFIKLSDGWASIWAAIQQKNLLYNYILERNKLKVGTKLALSLWSLHPISNILDFCSISDKKSKCIQFFYNGSIILHPNAKLGRIDQQFYRPLGKCRAKGGLIPVIQGIIVRLFSIKSNSKKGRGEHAFTLTNHFAEVLTVQGFVCLVKFSLNEQSSLVQYFRLYHSYRIYKLKINEQNMLCYLMEQSRFQEVKGVKISEKDQIYPKSICDLLQKRLLNANKAAQWQDGTYDVLCKNGKVALKCGKEYTFEVQGETSNFSSLYQQVTIERITDNFIKIFKNKHSSQLRRFPKIYDKLIE